MRFLFLLFIFLSFQTIAQNTFKVSIIDKNSLEPIPNCILQCKLIGNKDTLINAKSNSKGFWFYSFGNNEYSSIVVTSTHILFEPGYKKQVVKSGLHDTVEVKVFMTQSMQKQVNQVVVKAPGNPDTVFNSNEFSIADFEVMPDGNFLLLAYPKRIGKENMLFLYDGSFILSSYPVLDEGLKLVKDFRENIHLICSNQVIGIKVNPKNIELYQIPKDYFFQYIAPIVDSSTTKLFFSNFNKDYPAFDYFSYDTWDTTYRKLMHIEDDLMMELYRSEYKWVDVRIKLWAKQKELDSGIDAEVWVGANYFTQSLYYKEVYAPMFRLGDSIYIFDYQKDLLCVFNNRGDSIRSIPIYFHYDKAKSGWKRMMIKDSERNELYTVFEKNGYTFLGKINLVTGEIVEKYKLHYTYVEKIRIDNRSAYYIYRPFESIQKKFLYRERLTN